MKSWNACRIRNEMWPCDSNLCFRLHRLGTVLLPVELELPTDHAFVPWTIRKIDSADSCLDISQPLHRANISPKVCALLEIVGNIMVDIASTSNNIAATVVLAYIYLCLTNRICRTRITSAMQRRDEECCFSKRDKPVIVYCVRYRISRVRSISVEFISEKNQ